MTTQTKGTRPAPLSVRLTPDERARLERLAAGQPLGAYIKARLFTGESLKAGRRHSLVRDQRAIAQALAKLGRSELAASLRDLADAARSGSLDCDDELAETLAAGCADIRTIRLMLVAALGLKISAVPRPTLSTPRRAFSVAAHGADGS